MTRVGIAFTPCFSQMLRRFPSSTSTLQRMALAPAASASYLGPNDLHGGHQAAVKRITTGFPSFRTASYLLRARTVEAGAHARARLTPARTRRRKRARAPLQYCQGLLTNSRVPAFLPERRKGARAFHHRRRWGLTGRRRFGALPGGARVARARAGGAGSPFPFVGERLAAARGRGGGVCAAVGRAFGNEAGKEKGTGHLSLFRARRGTGGATRACPRAPGG